MKTQFTSSNDHQLSTGTARKRIKDVALPLAILAMLASSSTKTKAEGLASDEPIEITEITQVDEEAIFVTWTSESEGIYEIWHSHDLQSFTFLREEIGEDGTTTSKVPFSDFDSPERGFLQIRKSPFPTTDPVTQTSYPCYYIGNYTWNFAGDGVGNVVGRLRWPSLTCNASDGPPADRPLVIFMHGNGMDLNDHDYLMAHLARNGFVTASITNGGTNEERALQAISYLNSIHSYWAWSHQLSNKVVFAGHSRGAEAAVTAARLLAEQPSLAFTPYDVRSVIAIAPTDGGSNGAEAREHLDGSMSKSFLGLYGSRDGDVMGNAIVNPATSPERTVFSIYDRAGTESSSEGILYPPANIKKSLAFIYGANHNGFIHQEWQKDIAKGYFNAFLRWHVFGETEYRGYFDGSADPKTLCANKTEVYTQYSEVRRRVIDNFEQEGWAASTLGGVVSKGAGIAQIAENDLWKLDPSIPHETRGMRIKWSNTTSPAVHWRIPEANIPFVGPTRDVTSFKVLSLRVAQDYLDAWNSEGEDHDFNVRLYTGAGLSEFVAISDYGRIPYPDPLVVPLDGLILETLPLGAGDYTKTAMTTIRIPLEAFEGADLSDVRTVSFYFTAPGSESGSVVVDNLEFTP